MRWAGGVRWSVLAASWKGRMQRIYISLQLQKKTFNDVMQLKCCSMLAHYSCQVCEVPGSLSQDHLLSLLLVILLVA